MRARKIDALHEHTRERSTLGLWPRAIGTLAAALGLLLANAAFTEAATTAWDCESAGANYCAPSDKYSRGSIAYTKTGGAGASTDWVINSRLYAGSTGGNTGPLDRWRLESAHDWRWTNDAWAFLGSTGPGNWSTTPTFSPTFTIGSPRTILDSERIGLVMDFRLDACVWTRPDGVNLQCLTTVTSFSRTDSTKTSVASF